VASGQLVAGPFYPGAQEVDATGPRAGLDYRGNATVSDFDPNTTERLFFKALLSTAYGGGGLTFKLQFSATGVTSGNVVVDISIARILAGTDDLDGLTFASVQSATVNVPGTDGVTAIASVSFTNGAQMDSWAAGEYALVKVEFNSSGTVAADAEMLSAHALET